MTNLKISPYHKIFYNEWKLDPNTSKYNIVFDQTISNSLDIAKLQNALNRFIIDHLILNSHIEVIDNKEPNWALNTMVRPLDYFKHSEAAADQIYEYVTQPFNLENEPLYRFAVFVDNTCNNRFIIVMHHILIDGNSFDELISNISKYYNDPGYKIELALNEQSRLILAANDNCYNVYKATADKSQNFWQNILLNAEIIDLQFLQSEAMQMSANNPGNSNMNYFGEIIFKFENDNIINMLTQLKSGYSISIYWYGQIVLAILLWRYSSQNKFGIGYPTITQDQQGLIYGSQINTNILVYMFDNDTTVENLINQIKSLINTIKTGNFDYYPVYEIMKGQSKQLLDVFFARTNLRNTRFNFNNVPSIHVNNEFNIDLSAKLLFEVELKNQVPTFRVRYNATQLDEIAVHTFVKYYQKLFFDILSDLVQGIATKPIINYDFFDESEYEQIMDFTAYPG